MTPVLCLDPVSASAVAAGLTTAVGLGPLVCARVVRRRFVSESGRPGVHTTAEWDAFTATLTDEQHEALSDEAGRRGMSRSKVARIYGVKDTCPDCNGTGLVQPSGPQTMLIGATADMSDDLVYDYQDHLAAVDGPADVVWTSIGPHWGWHLAIRPAGEEWTSSNTTYRPIHPASILGTATVAYEINEALPFGPWTPGGPAAIVTDYRDTIDCDGAKTLSGPLSWSDAPTSPCITTIDLKENAA